eukprot:3852437-Alexandrium_andersonii.AAC.1
MVAEPDLGEVGTCPRCNTQTRNVRSAKPPTPPNTTWPPPDATMNEEPSPRAEPAPAPTGAPNSRQ